MFCSVPSCVSDKGLADIVAQTKDGCLVCLLANGKAADGDFVADWTTGWVVLYFCPEQPAITPPTHRRDILNTLHRFGLIAFVALLSFSGLTSAAEVYKKTVNGVTTYSDTPFDGAAPYTVGSGEVADLSTCDGAKAAKAAGVNPVIEIDGVKLDKLAIGSEKAKADASVDAAIAKNCAAAAPAK